MPPEAFPIEQADRAAVQAAWGRQLLLDGLRTLGTVGAALGVGFLITLLVSPRPFSAYAALLTGPLTSRNRFGNWLEDATSLALLGLALALVFQARQFSLLAEGQLYLGALVAGILALHLPLPSGIHAAVALLGAAAVGFLYGLIPGALKAYLNASELVSSLMLNVVAQRLYELLLTYWLKPPGAGYIWSDFFPGSAILARLIPGTRVNVALLIALGLALLTWLLLYRTSFGYALRMVGANPEFARYAGIPTRRIVLFAMALSGIPAALAGAHLALGIHQRLILSISIGLGFEGIVVALLARNNPALVPFAALLYSYLRVGGDIMERTAAVGSDLVRMIQGIIILFLTAEALAAWAQRRLASRRSTHVGA
jgi:simple sugar transport system permease protein